MAPTNFAFLCTGTSSYEDSFGVYLGPGIFLMALIAGMAAGALLYLPARKLSKSTSNSAKVISIILYLMAALVTIAVGLACWFYLSITTC